MRCHFCDKSDTTVIGTRRHDDSHVVRRVRRCNNCEKKFVTYECYVKEKKKIRREQQTTKSAKDIYKQIKKDYGDYVEEYDERF